MNINENREIKNMIDKLIEYSKEVDAQINELKEIKKNTEKIIKSYILNCENNENDSEIIYKSKFYNVKLEKIIKPKIKYEAIKIAASNGETDNLQIKSNIEVAKLISKDIDNSEDEITRKKLINYLLDYISYISNGDLIEEKKQNLIQYLIDTDNKRIKYIDIKDKSIYSKIDKDEIVEIKDGLEVNTAEYKISILDKN